MVPPCHFLLVAGYTFLIYHLICVSSLLVAAGSELKLLGGGRGAPKTSVESGDEEASIPAVSVRKGQGEKTRPMC